MLRQIQENLGLATDLLLHAQMGSVAHHDPYVVMRTPDAPEYFAGNALVLGERPAPEDRQRLESDFARLVGVTPAIVHRSFSWPERDRADLQLDAYAAHGYEATLCGVLVAERNAVHTNAINPCVAVRLLESDRDWQEWTHSTLATMPDPTSELSRRCVEFQRSAYRALIDAQWGNWWGAFIDGELVGSLGLFFFGRIGRFQSILTRPDQRNKHVCRTLLTEVVKRAAGAGDRLVIVADEGYHAVRLYESLGFERQAYIGSICRAPG